MRITRGRRFSWRVVLVGGAATLSLLAAVARYPSFAGAVPASLERTISAWGARVPEIALVPVVASPLMASIATLLLTKRVEYRIQRVNAAAVRVSGEFSRLIRMVGKLTPRDVLDYSLE